MKMPYYTILKVSVEDKTTLKAEWLDCVTCDECVYLNVQNTKYLYAICERHGIEFKPFEDDTRTHFCAWGIKTTENSSEKPNNCEGCKWGEWYRKGYDITMMDDECGGCCSWNSKWTPKDKPQTSRENTRDSRDNHEIAKDKPQTDCAWKRGENE